MEKKTNDHKDLRIRAAFAHRVGLGGLPRVMILALTVLALASSPADASLSVKVVSLDFSYPYVGEPGNSCQGAGSVYVRATADSKPVVVRLVNANGLSAGTEAVLDDVRRAGTGRDGTAVYCSAGIRAPGAPAPAAPVAAATTETPPPLVAAPVQPAAEPSAAPAAAPAPVAAAPVDAASSPTESRCTTQLFHIIKKPLEGKNKFGPSEFDPATPLSVAEAVDCSVARARNTNILLVRMVKDGYSKPDAVVGAEWGQGSWQKDSDAQRRVVKVYLLESPESAQR